MLPVNVRYLEVDGQGVVFNMWYLAYFDDALTAFLAHHGLDYGDLHAAGVDVVLVSTTVDWSGSVRWRDDVGVAVSVQRAGTTSFTMRYRVLRTGREVCVGTITYVCVETAGMTKQSLHPLLRQALGLDRSMDTVP